MRRKYGRYQPRRLLFRHVRWRDVTSLEFTLLRGARRSLQSVSLAPGKLGERLYADNCTRQLHSRGKQPFHSGRGKERPGRSADVDHN